MTVEVVLNKVSYPGDDADTSFDWAFYSADADLKALITDSNGNETELTQGVDFQITVNSGDETGGTVQYPISGDPLPTGSQITLYREVDFKQTVNLLTQGGFYAQNVEAMVDKITFMAQQLDEEKGRALRFGIASAFNDVRFPDLDANKVLCADAAGTGLEFRTASASLGVHTITTLAENLLDDATTGDMQTTLGVTAFMQTVLDDTSHTTARATLKAVGTEGNDSIAGVKTATGNWEFQAAVEVTDATGDAALGPEVKIRRESATPAVSDLMGGITFQGHNDAGTPEVIDYAALVSVLLDPTDGAEYGGSKIRSMINNVLTDILHFRQGVYTDGATGGDMGPDTLNISEYYLDGKMVRQGVVLFEETGSSVASFDVLDTDGLVAGYDWYEWEIECRPASDDEHLRMRTSADGSAGPTWDSTASDYYSTGSCWQGAGIYSWNLTSSATYIGLSYTSAGNEQSNVTTENPLRITVGFRDPSLSNETFGILSDGSGSRSTSQEYQRHIGKGERRTNAAVLGLQAYFGTGNVATYTQRLIGYKRT